MLPTLIQVLHECDDHNHEISLNKSDEVTELENPCDICSFNLVSFDYKTEEFIEVNSSANFDLKSYQHQNHFHNSLNFNPKQLRAPPINPS